MSGKVVEKDPPSCNRATTAAAEPRILNDFNQAARGNITKQDIEREKKRQK